MSRPAGDPWTDALGTLRAVRRRLAARRSLRRLWTALTLAAAGVLALLLLTHARPNVGHLLTPASLALAAAVTAVALVRHARQPPIPLRDAAWQADRGLTLPETAVAALEARPDDAFGAALRARVGASLAAADPAVLAPIPTDPRLFPAAAAALALVAALTLGGWPDGAERRAAAAAAAAAAADELAAAADALDAAGAPSALATSLHRTRRELRDKPRDADRQAQRAAGQLRQVDRARQRARDAREARQRVLDDPRLAPLQKASEASGGDTPSDAKPQLDALRRRLDGDDSTSASRERAAAARTLRRAADATSDRDLARELREHAALVARGQARDDLPKTLARLGQQAAQLPALTEARARLARAIRALGGQPATQADRPRDDDDPPAIGDPAGGGAIARPKDDDPRALGPWTPAPPVADDAADSLASARRWPLGERSLVHAYRDALAQEQQP